MSMPRVAWTFSVGALIGLAAGVASAQAYPTKPIRIVTSPPGGGGDFDSRLVASLIAAPLGQPVIVENRPGIIAAELVSKTPPDGHTLLVAGATLWTAPLLRQMPYDAARDFAPISPIEMSVAIVVVHPSVPVKSVKELIALAKARPGELNYASVGSGGIIHLTTVLFASMASVNITHVSYKAAGNALPDLISGQVQLMFASATSVAPHMKSGRLRALAVTSAEPSALTPGLPTVATALPGYEAVSVTGMFAPAKTAPAIVNRLNQELLRALNRADVKEKFADIGVEAVSSTPEAFVAAMKSDMAKWGKLIKDVGITAD